MVAINDGTAAPDNVTPAGAGRRKTIAARASSKSESLRLARKSAALPITLSLVVMTVRGDEPMISTLLLSEQPFGGTLPRGAFDPSQHQTLDDAARAIADNTTDLALGFVEQLITRLVSDTLATMTIEVCYLALLPPPSERKPRQMQKQNDSVSWQSVYVYLPWEDWRHGRPGIIDGLLLPRLQAWARSDEPTRPRAARNRTANARQARIRFAFGADRDTWDETRVVERFDVMVDAAIIALGVAPGADARDQARSTTSDPRLGQDLQSGERRLLAVALARLRVAIKTRPVVFELLPDEFTLFELQRTVETLLGPMLHKQNFRRQIETTGLVEPTGRVRTNTGGRPAKLFRFSKDVLVERPAAEAKPPRNRSKRTK